MIPTLGRGYAPPVHLDPFVQSLEAAWVRPVRQTTCAPPRHAKTDTILAFIALTLKRQPWKTIAYVSYEAKIAASKSRKARMWAQQLGVELAADAKRVGEWRTKDGGGLLAVGIGGPLTAQGVDILILDDPYKNRQQAESPAYCQLVIDWWADVANTRIEPGGSAFITHTRWTTNDLIAHVLTGEGKDQWERHIRLPAINDNGQALWPARWPVELLLGKKADNDYTWASLYQGDPRPRGGKVFHGASFFDELPAGGYRVAIGLDFAYSAKTSADWSVAVVMARVGDDYFILDVVRIQTEPRLFRRDHLAPLGRTYKGAPFLAYTSTTEKGVAALMCDPPPRHGADDAEQPYLDVEARLATVDKYVRATPFATAWNDGRVHVKAGAPWVPQLLLEIQNFTGARNGKDDQVDAGAAAFDRLAENDTVRKPSAARQPYRMAGAARGFG